MYKLAHSPDADDIFMYYALKFGWVDTDDISLENTSLDIETLNEKAIENFFDITAISFSVYPKIQKEYALLRTAVSFGEGYGPKLIAKKNAKLKKNFSVALSGTHTTNALIFKATYPDARPVYKNFLEIENSVLSGETDAGVLIHESILDYDKSLETRVHIFDLWKDLAKEDLPLPLGGMALRRSLPLNRAIQLEEILTKAVKIAVNNSNTLGNMLLERNLVRVNKQNLDTYLGLYANQNSISMSDLQLKAVEKLFKIGYEHGFYQDLISLEESLIPSDYKTLRNS